MNTTSYAINTTDCKATDAFNVIANFLLMNSCSDISLYPNKNIIVVTPTENDANVIEHVKDYIANSDDFNGVAVNPIILHDECRGQLIECGFAPGNILREIIEQQTAEIKVRGIQINELSLKSNQQADEIAKLNESKKTFCDLYYEAREKNDRIQAQVKAFAVLMDSIFPEK